MRQILADPLFVGFREIAHVKPGQRLGMAGGFRGSRAGMETREKFFRGDRVFAGVERGTAQRFHTNEDGSVRRENVQSVANEILSVVSFVAAEIPVMTGPGQR